MPRRRKNQGTPREIAAIIWQQITLATKMAIGAREQKIVPAESGIDYGGLALKIGGGLKSKIVSVVLDPSDTYTLRFYDSKWHSLGGTLSGVYVDVLNEILVRAANRSKREIGKEGNPNTDHVYDRGEKILFYIDGTHQKVGLITGTRFEAGIKWFVVNVPIGHGRLSTMDVLPQWIIRRVSDTEYARLARKHDAVGKNPITGNQVKFGMHGRTKVGWINDETPTRYWLTYYEHGKARHVWRRKDKVKFVLSGKKGRVKNVCPKTANSPQVTVEAVKAARMFTGLPTREVWNEHFEWPKALPMIGPCTEVEYVSHKFDGKLRRYYHKFGKGARIYFDNKPQRNGDHILIIRGPFKIKPEGITG